MQKGFAVVVFAILLSTPVFSQIAQPTPDGGVVKISTSLIQIDVSVTDKKGRAITDLKPEEIEIYENGEKQKITGFSFVTNVKKMLTPDKLDKSKKAIPEPPLVLKPDQVKRTVALVVDDLTLSFESAAYTRRALKKFVDDQMLDGDLVGIIRTGAGIGALQQFTSNKQQLYAAIERVKWNSAGRGRFGSFDPIEPTMAQTRRAQGDEFTTNADIQAEKDFNDSAKGFQESLFTTGTLGALKYIVGNMGELPGRKSVILFSDGFQIFPGVKNQIAAARLMGDERTIQPNAEGGFFAARTLDFLKELIALANRKSVIFYTIDARGLQTTGLTAADRLADPTLLDATALNAMQQVEADRSNELFGTQQGLVYLAKETGGFAYVNQNRMSDGVQKALDDQSYYLVAYEPDQESFDPEKRKFNRLEVKVLRNDTNVRHRSGFFVQDEAEEKVKIDMNAPTKIMRALTSPFAMNDINLKLNALFGYSPKRGYYVHSFLHIDAADLNFTKMPSGELQSNFDILAISYGDNGAAVDKENLVGTVRLKPEVYEKLKTQGISYSFIFPVKKPGAYQMRVALMDRASKEVGSANQFVEVPNLKKNGILLSGIVLENLSMNAWKRIAGPSQVNANAPIPPDDRTDPLQDTSLRKFRRGTVLRFGTELYNAKLPSLSQSKIYMQARVFHDRELVFENNEQPINLEGQDAAAPVYTDAVQLGQNLLPGDYVLQIVVTDGLAKDKKRIAMQYVQFEVIE
ncbi:MAG: VWA domain-containing protein [Acidobacteria bacterium]|nr:VWA domain-containing protein [Acidobacteriota bacterium]